MKTHRRKFKRTANACISCRQSKIKCSGEEPCRNCTRRGMRCRFVSVSDRVVVSRRYLESLQKAAQPADANADADADVEADVDDHDPERDPDFTDGSDSMRYLFEEQTPAASSMAPQDIRSVWTSPFTVPSTIIRLPYKNNSNWIWIAPSSMWSFTVRLSVMMTQKLHRESRDKLPDFSKEIYSLCWEPVALDTSPDTSSLPSLDHALYLFATAQFYLGHVYRFVNKEGFRQRLRIFYGGRALEAGSMEDRLWFAQLLLVLAFGKAYTTRSSDRGEPSEPGDTKGPPGFAFFLRALSLIPDASRLWRAGLSAIEVLTLAAVYLYALDHREAAHAYITQAIHIAQLDGLHTALPEEQLGAHALRRYRTLWWTLYHLNRHFSSSVGIPVSTHDGDATALPLPEDDATPEDNTLRLQVKMSQLMSFILTTIYKTERTALSSFLEKTRSILHIMAGHAQEIESLLHPAIPGSLEAVSKGARHVALLYHECVMYATRPLLLSVLKERLEAPSSGDWQSYDVVRPLISTGIKSASKTLHIISEYGFDPFLPFDLEFTYCAALHLTIAYALFPHAGESTKHCELAHALLDDMIRKGNRLAELRRQEFTYLQKLFQEMPPIPSMSSPQAEITTLPSPEEFETVSYHSTTVMETEDVGDHFGISSDDFLSLVGQINAEMMLDTTKEWTM